MPEERSGCPTQSLLLPLCHFVRPSLLRTILLLTMVDPVGAGWTITASATQDLNAISSGKFGDVAVHIAGTTWFGLMFLTNTAIALYLLIIVVSPSTLAHMPANLPFSAPIPPNT